MSIRFVCEHCGHPIDVPDRLGGVHGKCKHCGHSVIVPEGHAEAPEPEPDGGLRLRAIADEPARVAPHLLAAEVPLNVRPATAEPKRKPEAVSDPDEALANLGRADDDYDVSNEGQIPRRRSSAGPPPLWVNLPTLTARFFASKFRSLRDWLYVVSIGALVIVLLGYLYHSRTVLHLGAVLVVASNISMLVVSIAYLVTLPFKESLWIGLANVLVPFYAVYYWSTRWHRMKRPVINTFKSFVPILLVGVAYLIWEEAPVIEKELPALEERIEGKLPKLEKAVDGALKPAEDSVKRGFGSERDEQ